MDRFLKPKDLETSPKDPEAAKVCKYWLTTFETFLQTVEAGQSAINPNVEVNRIGLLVNFLSPAVYSYVEDRETYDEALVIPKRVYVKSKTTFPQDNFLQLENNELQKAFNNSFKPQNYFRKIVRSKR